MAHNPQAPQGPEGHPDPAGSTQMFRAFVDEGAPGPQQQRGPAPQPPAGPRVGMIVGVVVAVVVLAAVGWLAFA